MKSNVFVVLLRILAFFTSLLESILRLSGKNASDKVKKSATEYVVVAGVCT